jgi:hypothetical protein
MSSELLALKLRLVFLSPFLQFPVALRGLVGLRVRRNVGSKFRD